MQTIVYIKYRKPNGFEVSSYFDFTQSLKKATLKVKNCTDWEGVFQKRVMLKPKTNHLSYFDWHNNEVKYNDSDNYRVVNDIENGLTFMHKGDHKMIHVESRNKDLKECVRTLLHSRMYGYIVFYDHNIRRKI